MTDLRLTWVQPEDLVGHELRQAEEDGRDAKAVAERWHTAGGTTAPPRTGASPAPAPPHLRALAEELLDELALLPCPQEQYEPTELSAIRAACPAWPGRPGRGNGSAAPEARTAVGRPAAPEPAAARESAPAEGRPYAREGGTPAAPDRPHAPAEPAARGETAPAGGRPGGPAARDLPYRTGDGTAASPGRPYGTSASSGPPYGTASAAADGREAAVHLTVARLHAAWLGRAVGCLLGKPVEKLPLTGIRALARATGNWPLRTWFTAEGLPPGLAAAYPWNRRSAPTSLAENIDGMPEDDDLNYPLLNLLLLRRHGRSFTTADVARVWLDELPAGCTFTAERVAYRNLLCGIEPPDTARYRNPFREWIGAAIRADVHGWTHPGAPGAAAAQAHREATLTHTANGVYGAMFVAGMIAAAAGPYITGPKDVHACLRAGLSVVPPRSRLAGAVRFGIEAAGEQADFAAVVDRIHSAYGHYHWVHSVPNAALLAAALTHADGDFGGSICRVVSGGWDTDSNGATAGSVTGLLAGDPAALPERWTVPLKNRLATSVAGFDGIGFDALAELTHREALRP
ncbi:ADP-ribosylglycohydrolase family protein [Streptomyces sp. NPDC057617]|uniref:ADP-ribosylglycohydrolase family protein n=1 Tax=Streptomyces sp. NPDC057617 TaxID=3346184 RepID=UPI00367F761A